jgi:phospholipase/carboxylesterase
MLRDFHLPPLSGGAPRQAVIFLHGLGDRGDGGLLSIGQVWQRALPDCEFICPDAPFAYDMAPPDFGGRQWFSLKDFAPDALEAGVRAAVPVLNDYIDHVLKTRDLPPEKLALVGFSQGTMMALYVAPRRAAQIACVVGYSGLLRGAETLKAEKKSSPPVLLLHGTYDEVVPYARMDEAERGLKKAGIPVSTVSCPGLAHGIDDRGILEGLKFLQKHLAGI